MSSTPQNLPQHFRINWFGLGLDGRTFTSQQDAQKAASFLVGPHEPFTVEQFDHTCPVCEQLESSSSSPNT
ncbi:MAG: hypothetical protein WCC21_01050 [Candidatus Acidiferrales bacterium]